MKGLIGIGSQGRWKAVYVPAITFANAVCVQNSIFCDIMDGVQREVIRYAMGCRFNCSNEFVEGEAGMSKFIEREIQSKLRYWIRIRDIGDKRW